MEGRINYHVRGLFSLNEKTIPPILEKHLTNSIFKKPNKEAMEQVVYYMIFLISPKCLKTVPWPITTFKESAEFRNAATLIINGLDGFVYKRSSNVGKVNSSLLANAGGPMFINFMYQFCVYIKCRVLKMKGISVLNEPLYVKDKYINKKIAMFEGISNSNFNQVQEIISKIERALKNITELAVEGKESILNGKQRLNYMKSALLNIEHCDITANAVTELKEKYTDLFNNFEQNKLIAMQCSKLADIILKTPESWDANTIHFNINVNKESLIGDDGRVDLVKLLTIIKNTQKNCIIYCEELNDDEKINDKLLEAQQSVIVMTHQKQNYEKIIEIQNNAIDHLKIENQELEKEILSITTLESIDHILLSIYTPISPVILKADVTDSPKLVISENNKKFRRSILSNCNNEPYNYQKLSFDEIKEVYLEILLNQNKVNTQDGINENDNEYSTSSCEINPTSQISLLQDNDSENLEDKEVKNITTQVQNKEDEVKCISVSRRSIENIKQKFMRIKSKGQAMNTIPHSPQSPF